MTADKDKALRNAEAALLRLESFLALPVQNDRDRAGIIQAFEFTFECCWKLLQKVAQGQGLQVPSPRAAIKAGFQLGLCEPEETWLIMLDDRNLTAHTYRAELAMAIFERVAAHHAAALRRVIDASRALSQM